ncbi:MAG: yeiE [Gammaproteobacteria bacterium]|jgi:DNA-binding transcriptional LysR family regulator|nr:yeiE [Gammaproteobacteria bacterium]
MRISAKQIALFLEVAKQENVSKAAEALHLTQSAASMGLIELEKQLGVKLFDRLGKKLVLNQTGEALLPKALEIIIKIQEFEDFSIQRNQMKGELLIGASTTIANYLLPKIISQFVQAYPEVKVSLQVGNTEQIIDQTKHFHLDIGFIEGPCATEELKLEDWQQDELVIFARAGHSLAETELSLEELSQAKWILREKGSGTREIFERAIFNKLASLNILLELGSAEAVKQAVMVTEALGCVSALALQKELEAGSLIKLKVSELHIKRELSILTHPARSESVILQAFRKMCLAEKVDKPRIKLKALVI